MSGRSRPGQRLVRRQIVRRVVGCCQDLDAEPVQQGPRPERRLAQPVTYLVVQGVRVGRARSFSETEDLGKFAVEPVPHRGSPEHSPICAQPSPRVPGQVLRHWTFTDAQLVQRHPAGVQKPGHVVVRLHQQTRRVCKRLVLEQQSWINVAVRGDDRPFPDLFVQAPCDGAHLGIGGEEPVRMHRQWCEVTRHGTHAGRLVWSEQSVAVCCRPSGPNSNYGRGVLERSGRS